MVFSRKENVTASRSLAKQSPVKRAHLPPTPRTAQGVRAMPGTISLFCQTFLRAPFIAPGVLDKDGRHSLPRSMPQEFVGVFVDVNPTVFKCLLHICDVLIAQWCKGFSQFDLRILVRNFNFLGLYQRNIKVIGTDFLKPHHFLAQAHITLQRTKTIVGDLYLGLPVHPAWIKARAQQIAAPWPVRGRIPGFTFSGQLFARHTHQ